MPGSRGIFLFENVPRWIREIPEHLKTQEMCDEAVWIEQSSLAFVPDRLKREDMRNEAVGRDAYALEYVPINLITQKICNEAMRENSAAFFSSLAILKHKNMYHGP